MALPLVYLIIFQYVPMYGAQLAFKKYRAALGIWGSEWVGLQHFITFFQSFQFQRIVRNTISISAYSLVAGFPVPIILAIALNNSQARRFKKTVQLVTYAPHFISTVVMCGMIIQFLSPSVGIVNKFIAAFGLQPVGFMGRLNRRLAAAAAYSGHQPHGRSGIVRAAVSAAETARTAYHSPAVPALLGGLFAARTESGNAGVTCSPNRDNFTLSTLNSVTERDRRELDIRGGLCSSAA